jgi:hypothetical protein
MNNFGIHDKKAFTRKKRRPVAEGFFDDLPSTLERIISPLYRGDLGVCRNDNQTHPALRAPLSRGESCDTGDFFRDDSGTTRLRSLTIELSEGKLLRYTN